MARCSTMRLTTIALLGACMLLPSWRDAQAAGGEKVASVTRIARVKRALRPRLAKARHALKHFNSGRAAAVGGEAFVGYRTGFALTGGGDVGVVAMRDSFGKIALGLRLTPSAQVGITMGWWTRAGARVFGTPDPGTTLSTISAPMAQVNASVTNGTGGGVEIAYTGRTGREGMGSIGAYATFGEGLEVPTIGLGYQKNVAAPRSWTALNFRSPALRRAEKGDALAKEAKDLLQRGATVKAVDKAEKLMARVDELLVD